MLSINGEGEMICTNTKQKYNRKGYVFYTEHKSSREKCSSNAKSPIFWLLYLIIKKKKITEKTIFFTGLFYLGVGK